MSGTDSESDGSKGGWEAGDKIGPRARARVSKRRRTGGKGAVQEGGTWGEPGI